MMMYFGQDLDSKEKVAGILTSLRQVNDAKPARHSIVLDRIFFFH